MTDMEDATPGAPTKPISQSAPGDVSGSWLDDINLAINNAAAAITGQGISLDPEAARAVLNRAYDIEEKIKRLQDSAWRLDKINPPADDATSKLYHGQLTRKGDPGAFAYGMGHLQVEQGYLATLIERLELALGITRSTEDASAAETKRAAETEEGFLG